MRSKYLNVAKQAWRFFGTRGITEQTIGQCHALVCCTDNNGDYVVVTGPAGIERFAVRKSWR
jgi:hypothetical protein